MADRFSELGWVLHRRPFRDTSLLLDVFTRERGRIALIGRGARAAKKRAPIQPLRCYQTAWTSGRGDLGTLISAEPVTGSAPSIGEPMLCGLYCNELVLRLTARDDPHPELFDVYEATLEELAAVQVDTSTLPDAALRAFELAALHAAGASFSLTQDARGNPLDPDAHYYVDPEHGLRAFAVARGRHADTARGIADDATPHIGQHVVQNAAHNAAHNAALGSTILALAEGEFGAHTPAPERAEIRRLLAGALAPLLGERPLRSAAMLRELRALRAPVQSSPPNTQSSTS